MSGETDIIIHIEYEDVIYLFYVDITLYPFIPPKVAIKGVPHVQYFGLKSARFTNILNKLTGKMCLCCETILCKNMWSCGCKFSNILDEIKSFRKIIIHIAYKILADKIKDKYLIDDIDLDSWLF